MELLQGRYQIQQQLGKKAGRQTLLAEDIQTQSLVVVKLLTFSDEFEWDDLKLFEREAEALKTLNYPAIPRYLDYFELELLDRKGFALVQSYIDAKSLDQHLKAGRTFSETEVKQLSRSLLEILSYLHSQQPPVIHRDLKPSNILLSDRTGNHVGQVYLVDFGSVQTLLAQEGSTITIVGTYGYMPPEQYGGRATPASDLYSLGATLVYLVTGKHPADLPQANLQIQFKPSATISEAFADWLEWMTKPALDQRLTSTQQAIQALEEARSPLAIAAQSQHKIVPHVNRERVLWNAIWRSSSIDAVFGVSSFTAMMLMDVLRHRFFMYGSYQAFLISLLSLGILGGSLGLGLGFFNGLLAGALTNRFFSPLKNVQLYRWTIGIATTVFSLAIMLVVMKLLSPVWGFGPLVLIGELSAGVASQLFVRWYIRESRKVEP